MKTHVSCPGPRGVLITLVMNRVFHARHRGLFPTSPDPPASPAYTCGAPSGPFCLDARGHSHRHQGEYVPDRIRIRGPRAGDEPCFPSGPGTGAPGLAPGGCMSRAGVAKNAGNAETFRAFARSRVAPCAAAVRLAGGFGGLGMTNGVRRAPCARSSWLPLCSLSCFSDRAAFHGAQGVCRVGTVTHSHADRLHVGAVSRGPVASSPEVPPTRAPHRDEWRGPSPNSSWAVGWMFSAPRGGPSSRHRLRSLPTHKAVGRRSPGCGSPS
jgi:hypothetical protein